MRGLLEVREAMTVIADLGRHPGAELDAETRNLKITSASGC
jgi:hypothetical protein